MKCVGLKPLLRSIADPTNIVSSQTLAKSCTPKPAMVYRFSCGQPLGTHTKMLFNGGIKVNRIKDGSKNFGKVKGKWKTEEDSEKWKGN